jgi:hypothetical protein
MSHTPGPWFVIPHNQGGGFEIGDKPTVDTANVLCTRFEWPEKSAEMAANARLIAAAPELLEALVAFMRLDPTFELASDQCVRRMIVEKLPAAALANAVLAARAAIAKATG